MILTFPEVRPLDSEERKSLVEQVYYVHPRIDEARFENGHLTIEFSGPDADVAAIRERVATLAADNARAFRRSEPVVLFSLDGTVPKPNDPLEALIASGQILQARTSGVMLFRGDLLRAMRSLDHVVRNLAEKVEAEELEVPTTVPLPSLIKAGYIASFPQHALFVAPIRADMEAIRAVEVAARSSDAIDAIASNVTEPNQVLSPTICYHCFEALRGTRVGDAGLSFTALGKCHRHEHKTTRGLERLQTFTMRELIFFGSQRQVADKIKIILDATRALLESWGLRSRVVAASDPFFAIEASKKRTFQMLFGLKQEIQVWLPTAEKWLAAGSFNHHRSTLVGPFGIEGAGSAPLESGCIGFGYERLLCGVFSQFGIDPQHWSSGIQKSLLAGA